MADLSPYINFSFKIDVSGAQPVCIFTDNSSYPAGVNIGGFLSVTQPDGITISTPLTGTPDITASGQSVTKPYRLASDNTPQNGTYTIIYTVVANGYDNTVVTKTFTLNYAKQALDVYPHIDVFTPFIFADDKTKYGTEELTAASVSRTWSATIDSPFTNTLALSGIAKIFNLAYKENYYDAQYAISLVSVVNYQLSNAKWISLTDSITTEKKIDVYAPLSIPFLQNAILELLKCAHKNECECGCNGHGNDKAYKAIVLLYKLNKDSLKGNVECLPETEHELEKILFPDTIKSHTYKIIDPYNVRFVKRVNYKRADLNGNVLIDLSLDASGVLSLTGSDEKIDLTAFLDAVTGALADLETSDRTSLVNAINSIVNMIQGDMGYAQPNDSVTSIFPKFRLFINNSASSVTYTNYKDASGNSLIIAANSIGLLIYTGSAWSALTYVINKTTIGLGNVDNTSDINKPISNATQTAINNLQTEITNTQNALQALSKITAIVDAVATYAALMAIPTTGLPTGDSYIVLQDETRGGNASVYTWGNSGWVWIGEWDTSAATGVSIVQDLSAPTTNTVLSTEGLQSIVNLIWDTIFSGQNPALSATANSVTATANMPPSVVAAIGFNLILNGNVVQRSEWIAGNPTNGTPSAVFTGLNASTTYRVSIIYFPISSLGNGQTPVMGSSTITTLAPPVTDTPTITQLSDSGGSPGGTHTQVFQVGATINAGDVFYVETYSHTVSVTAVSGDTNTTIATKLAAAVNATTTAEWNSASSAPATGTNGFPPTATSSGSNITITLNYQNSFIAGANPAST